MMTSRELEAQKLQKDWNENPRWKGIKRGYTADDVVRLRGSIQIEHTLAKRGSEKLWNLITTEPFVNALGALTGNQAMQQVKAGLKAIYLSGWQVAGDANNAGEMYPDQSLYPANSVPQVVKRINNTFQRADQIQWSEGKGDVDFFAPIVADAEAGFGGVLNAFELMKSMIEAGASGVHFEDQLASVKKCGHMGGKVLVPTRELAVQIEDEIHGLSYHTTLTSAAVYGGVEMGPQERALKAGVDIIHVPYRGVGPATTDLLGGQVDGMFLQMAVAKRHAMAGKLQVIATPSPQRVPAMPDVPTLSETIVPGFEVVPWFGVVAPAGTPAPIVNRLHSELQAILSSPDVKNQLAEQGAEAVAIGPEPFARFIKSEVIRWGELIRLVGVKID